ncbi:MAG: hypothetical protein IIA23_11835, partial [Chloroflexi bacterium]|nr:hypothetical protein [Chloroflexota bacterium]
LPFNVSDVWESGILSRDQWDEVGGEDGYQNDPIGTGPWTYVSHEIGVSYLHERVVDHWRQTPEFHELLYLQIQEPATRLAMLFAGEADIIPLVADQKEQILSGGFKTSKATLPSVNQSIAFIFYREMNYVDPATGEPPTGGREKGSPDGYDPNDPLRNPQVRLALNYAVNRNELNDVFYDGDGFPDATDDCPGTDIHAGGDGALGPPEDFNHNGIQDSESAFTTDDSVLVFEDYDGVIDTDGCHDSPGDDFDGDSFGALLNGLPLFHDEHEALFPGTDPFYACAATPTPDDESGPDRWPFDFNDDQRASIGDVIRYIAVFNTQDPDPSYDQRFDFTGDGRIAIADVILYIPVFNTTCLR